jgi:glycosyltransferase involved in cell wall biosynthesis
MPKRLLVISFNFPPSNEVAGKVMARQLRYLGGHGWETVVVAPPVEASIQLDREGYADIEGVVRVERTEPFTSAFEAVVKLRLLKNRMFGGPTTRAGLALAAPATEQKTNSWTSKVKRQLRELCTFPDNCSGWIGPAKRTALRLLKHERFDAVMSVSPSVSAHVAALKVHRRYRELPWIANFHDPWSRMERRRTRTKTLQRIERRLEQKVVCGADLVMCATEELRDAFAADHPSQRNYLCLSNGFDSADLPTIPAERPADGRLILTYAGSMYLNRNPVGLFQALSKLIAAGRLQRERVLVRFIGDCERVGDRSLSAMVAEYGLEGIVEVIPPVTYPKALEYLAASDVLLMFAEGQPLQIPAKTFEFLFMKRRVLAICDGATARILKELQAGAVVTSADVAGIATAIEHWAREVDRGESPPVVPQHTLDQFRAETLAGILSDAMNGLLDAQKVTHDTTVRHAEGRV